MMQHSRSSESQSELMRKAQVAVEEARMVVPGLQALFGFQMMSIFNARFETLTLCGQRLHLFAIFLTTLSIALLMLSLTFDVYIVTILIVQSVVLSAT